MSEFRLIYDEADERRGCPSVAIEAEHATVVLSFLEHHYVNRPVELWRDGECLGHLERMRDHGAKFWRVTA